MRTDDDLLQDMLESIRKILDHLPQGFDRFQSDEMVQVFFIHHLQIIGEAARKISSELQQCYPEIPWSEIISMRNILVHNYFGIDLNEVWYTAQKNLPELKSQIESVIQNLQ